MPSFSESFPAKYLKATDLKGKSHRLTIQEVPKEEMKDGSSKFVVYFKGKDKGLVLNKTNGEKIAAKHGDDTDGWKGAEIELYPDTTQYQGQLVDCIRVRMMVPAVTEDDDIPF